MVIFFDTDGTADGTDGQQGKVHFVVSRADLTYKLPLLVDDNLVVAVTDVVKNPPVSS